MVSEYKLAARTMWSSGSMLVLDSSAPAVRTCSIAGRECSSSTHSRLDSSSQSCMQLINNRAVLVSRDKGDCRRAPAGCAGAAAGSNGGTGAGRPQHCWTDCKTCSQAIGHNRGDQQPTCAGTWACPSWSPRNTAVSISKPGDIPDVELAGVLERLNGWAERMHKARDCNVYLWTQR